MIKELEWLFVNHFSAFFEFVFDLVSQRIPACINTECFDAMNITGRRPGVTTSGASMSMWQPLKLPAPLDGLL